MTQEELLRLPKVELHCHLDGSLSQEFIEKRLGRSVKKEELSVSDDCTSLAEYLEKFDMPCQCLKDEEGLEEAGYDVLKSMSREHVCYAEIRFAPLFSETESMSCKRAMEALIKGLERGKQDFNIAACVYFSLLCQQCCAHLKAGIGSIGKIQLFDCCVDQLFNHCFFHIIHRY